MVDARFKKGLVPWNKGKTGILTPDQLKKMSESHKGKKLSEEHRKNMSGRIPWNKGISPSEETRKKISESNKGRTSPMKGKKPSAETIEKSRLSHLKLVNRSQGVTFSENLDTDWARLLGYLLSDGYWGKNQTLKFVNNNLTSPLL
ncbi:MAG: NUMOD3 domain-containing DNA-binding protein [Nanoarchaeota archaeon]